MCQCTFALAVHCDSFVYWVQNCCSQFREFSIKAEFLYGLICVWLFRNNTHSSFRQKYVSLKWMRQRWSLREVFIISAGCAAVFATRFDAILNILSKNPDTVVSFTEMRKKSTAGSQDKQILLSRSSWCALIPTQGRNAELWIL